MKLQSFGKMVEKQKLAVLEIMPRGYVLVEKFFSVLMNNMYPIDPCPGCGKSFWIVRSGFGPF